MARITSKPEDAEKPRIDHDAVVEFFEQRAKKYDILGPLRTVIYQDKHPDLAERRDVAEKALLGSKLELNKSSRVLDVGCGTGRWADFISRQCGAYHGADISPGLIAHAKAAFASRPNVKFSVCSADALSLKALNEALPFDRTLSAGVAIYMNDDEAQGMFGAIASVAARQNALVLMREPIGTAYRLTIKEHFSEDMEQTYNAIYRTKDELLSLIMSGFDKVGLKLAESGDVYSDQSLNNRAETQQKWFVFRN